MILLRKCGIIIIAVNINGAAGLRRRFYYFFGEVDDKMSEAFVAILAAIITGAVSLTGTVITVLAANNKTQAALKVSQAVMDTKIDELTREVREHNNFARRMPVVEEQIKSLNHRVSDIESGGNK